MPLFQSTPVWRPGHHHRRGGGLSGRASETIGKKLSIRFLIIYAATMKTDGDKLRTRSDYEPTDVWPASTKAAHKQNAKYDFQVGDPPDYDMSNYQWQWNFMLQGAIGYQLVDVTVTRMKRTINGVEAYSLSITFKGTSHGWRHEHDHITDAAGAEPRLARIAITFKNMNGELISSREYGKARFECGDNARPFHFGGVITKDEFHSAGAWFVQAAMESGYWMPC